MKNTNLNQFNTQFNSSHACKYMCQSTQFLENEYKLLEHSANLIEEIRSLKKDYELLKTEQKNAMPVLLNAEGVRKITGWSLKTVQKAMQDSRMKTIWVGKGPQVEIGELKRYLALNIDRSTDPYWTNN